MSGTLARRDPRKPIVQAIDVAGRTPPNDRGAEAAVLGAVLMGGKALDDVTFLEPENFYVGIHATVFEAARAVHAKREPVDIQTVASWLSDRDRLQAIGGMETLADLVDASPSVAHVEAYARAVKGKALARRVIETAQQIAAEGYGDYGEAEAFAASAEERLSALAHSQRPTSRTMRQIIDKRLRELQDQHDGKINPWGISFGRDLPRLNSHLRGARPGEVIIIGADTGVGKTALGHQIVMEMVGSKYQGRTVGGLEIALEMTGEDVADRSLCTETDLGDFELQTGHFLQIDDTTGRHRKGSKLAAETLARLVQMAKAIAAKPLIIDEGDQTLGSIQGVVRSSRRTLKRDYDADLRVVMLDHIGLVDDDDARDNEMRQLKILCKGLKRIAVNDRIVMIVLCQLNREGSKSDRPPTKTDRKSTRLNSSH